MLPEPYYRSPDGRHTIYHADCRDVLTGLLPGSVDAVVTDPPYGIVEGAAFKRGANSIEGGEGDFNSGGCGWEWLEDQSFLKTGGNVASFHRRGDPLPDTLIHWHRFYLVKSNPYPTPRPVFCSGVEECTIANRPGGKRTWNGGGSTPNYVVCSMAEGHLPGLEHKSPKPLKAILILVRCLSYPGDLVLDPFLGSGTTSVACVQTGRRSIGIEQNERYCEIAVQRLERTLAQPTLFVQERITDAQESLELTG